MNPSLRRKRDECKTYNRKSLDYRENDEANEAFDDEEKFSDNTLDHNTNIKEMKNNIRQVMRSKYKIDDSYTIKHFGYIDQPNEVTKYVLNYNEKFRNCFKLLL